MFRAELKKPGFPEDPALELANPKTEDSAKLISTANVTVSVPFAMPGERVSSEFQPFVRLKRFS